MSKSRKSKTQKTESQLLAELEALRARVAAVEEAEAAIAQRNRQLLALQQAGAAITSSLDLQQVLDTVTREMAKLLEVEACALSEWNRDADTLSVIAEYGPADWFGEGSLVQVYSLADYPLTKQVLITRRPEQMTLNRPDIDPAELAFMQQAGIKTLLMLPMEFQKRVVGLVELMDAQAERTFTGQEITLAQLLANQAGSAIESARLYEQARQEVAERKRAETAERAQRELAETLGRVGLALNSTLDLPELLELICRESIDLFQVEAVHIWLVQEDDLVGFAAYGPGREKLIGRRIPLADSRSLTVKVIREKRPIFVNDAPNSSQVNQELVSLFQAKSILGVPLLKGDKAVGTLMILDTGQTQRFGPDDVEMPMVLGSYAAIAIENAHLFDEARRRAAQLEALRQVWQDLAVLRDLDTLLGQITKRAIQLFGAEAGGIYLYRPERQVLEWVVAGGENLAPIGLTLKKGEGLSGKVWATGEPLIVDDYDKWPGRSPQWPAVPRSVVGVPVRWGDEFLGVLTLSVGRGRRRFTAEDVALLSQFATQAAVAIRNARLFGTIRQHVAELEAVRQASLSLTESLELPQVLKAILSAAINMASARDAHVFLYEEGRLSFAAAQWADGRSDTPYSRTRAGGLTDTVARTGEPIIVPDMREHPLFANAPSDWQGAIAGLPLKIHQRVVGVMNVARSGAGPFSEAELRVLYLLADQAAVAIQNARLYEQAQQEIAERRQAEAALRKSEQAFQTILNSISDYVWSADIVDGQVVYRYYSPVVERITGYPPEYFMSSVEAWLNLIHPEDRAQAEIEIERELSGEVVTHEYRIIRQDGQVRWLYGTTSPTLDESGQVIRLDGVVSDITERKQLEEQIRVSLERRGRQVQTSTEVAQEIAAAPALDDLYRRVVNLVQERFGYYHAHIYTLEGGDLVMVMQEGTGEPGRQMKEKGHQIALAAEKSLVARAARSGEPVLVSDVTQAPDWLPNPLLPETKSELAVPIKLRDEVVGVLDVQQDRLGGLSQEDQLLLMGLCGQIAVAIKNRQTETELKLAMAETAAARDEVDAILHSVADGLIVTDLDHNVILANPAAEALLGFQLKEMLGRKIGTGIKDDRLRKIVLDTLAQRTSGYEVDIELEDPHNERPRVMRARTALVDDRHGQPLGTVTIIQDITRLREADRLKTEFLSTAAHELRTPLTSILGFSEILLTRELDPKRQKRYLNMINEQSIQLGEIIGNLIDVSRLEAGRDLEIKSEPVNLAELMQGVVMPFIETATNHDIRLEGLADLPTIMGDSFRLAQVGRNLLSNAIRYSPEGGTITICGRAIPGYVEVSVQDEGAGMTPAQQEHLFTPFYRADASDTAIGGAGLGLAISKLVVEQHGGKIWIESQSGIGTTVYFTLPLAKNGTVESGG